MTAGVVSHSQHTSQAIAHGVLDVKPVVGAPPHEGGGHVDSRARRGPGAQQSESQESMNIDRPQSADEASQVALGPPEIVDDGGDEQHVIGGPKRGDGRDWIWGRQVYLAMPDPIDGANAPITDLISGQFLDAPQSPRHQARRCHAVAATPGRGEATESTRAEA
jgi:hypothetical protein